VREWTGEESQVELARGAEITPQALELLSTPFAAG
jgi:hypothetical protein